MVSVTNGGVGPSTGSQQQFVPVLAQTDQNGAPTGGLFANNQQIAGSAVAGNTTGVVAPFTQIQAVALQGMVSGAGKALKSIQNFDPKNYPVTRKSLGAQQASGTSFGVLCIGDSTTGGATTQ